jgi:hypothetical protein
MKERVKKRRCPSHLKDMSSENKQKVARPYKSVVEKWKNLHLLTENVIGCSEEREPGSCEGASIKHAGVDGQEHAESSAQRRD